MEIRCSKCQHVGPATVLPAAGGVVLVCENCGHHNPLDVDGSEAGEATASPDLPTVDSTTSPLLRRGALERLVPEAGEGPRCRKCARLLADAEEHCPRCGLSVAEGARYSEGEAPWERPPEGKEGVYEQATLLWKAVESNPTTDDLTKFVEFVRDEQLLEYGVRQLRFFLAEHPDEPTAIGHLNELAASFQSKMIVAKAEAQVRADDFTLKSGRLKNIVIGVVFVLWGGIFIFFLTQISNGCA